MGNGKETAGKLDLGLRTSLGGGLSRNEFPMEARVPIALEFEEQNYASMSHGFPPTQGDFAGLGQESHSSTHLQFLEVHIKPEPSMNEGSEDIDVDYMMEKPIEFVNGNGTVTEEQERRRIRRERNKVAASKCRKKRKEHVKTLVEASEELENQNHDLQGQISKLQAEIKQLEFMLDSHSCSKYSHSQQEDEEYGLNAT